MGFRVHSFEFGEGLLEVGQLVDVGPVVGGRCAVELEDLEDLVDFRIAIKEGSFLDEFGENAAYCPNIHSKTVLFLAKQHLRSSIPEGLDLMSEGLDGNSKSTRQPKVSNFEITSFIDKKVLRLEVPVDDPAGVAVVNPVDQLVQ